MTSEMKEDTGRGLEGTRVQELLSPCSWSEPPPSGTCKCSPTSKLSEPRALGGFVEASSFSMRIH